jgi:hypothetical protein
MKLVVLQSSHIDRNVIILSKLAPYSGVARQRRYIWLLLRSKGPKRVDINTDNL